MPGIICRSTGVGSALAVLLSACAYAESDATGGGSTGLSSREASIQIEDYLFRLAQDITANSLSHAKTLAEWEAYRPIARKRLLYMVGLDPLPERTPLKAKVTRTLDKEGFTVECLYFESLPGFIVTANLYLPKERTGRLPTIVYLCGHAGGPSGAKGHYRHHPIWYARNGYACLIVDPIQHSEIPGRHHYTYRNEGWENFSTGFTPAGIEIWNAVRALDYLETRSEIDKGRIGITGRSGGGTFSYFTAAVDDRIQVVVSDHATYSMCSHITADTLRGHCDCNFWMNVDRIDPIDYCALLAPRPALSQCSTDDTCFPPKGYRDWLERMRGVYALYGKVDQIEQVDVPGIHTDFEAFQSNAMNFFNRWLRGERTAAKVDRKAVLAVMPDEAEPRVWADPNQRPKTFINERINRLLAPTYVQRYAAGAAPPGDRTAMTDLLRRNVFVAWPERKCPMRPELLSEETREGVRHFRYLLETEEGLRILAEISVPTKLGRNPEGIVWVSSGPDDPFAAEIEPLQARLPIVRVYPRGLRGSRWDRKIEVFVRRAASLMGQTVDSGRVYDVSRAIDLLQALAHGCGERMTVIGTGELGVIGMYAAIMDGRIRRVAVHQPTLTHYEGPILPNVLRYTDVPMTASYLPPTELILIGSEPSGLAPARKRFAEMGLADRYRVVSSAAGMWTK
ncbi:MAG: acetylxylan esterase [Phycisphaerae bacterium]|nr:acetylxylan esterase [Phycisphaerae bacterium]